MPDSRYAIFWSPAQGSALSGLLNGLIGYDAANGLPVRLSVPPGYAADEWRAMTSEPRRYGVHATLKAPFRLRDGCQIGDLERAMRRLCVSCPPVFLGKLALTAINAQDRRAFLALTCRPNYALSRLEAMIVGDLDEFRAQLTEAEIKRRRPELLSDRQRELLAQFGYPFVLDEFRFHVTLTNAVPDPERALAALSQHMLRSAEALHAQTLSAISLFEQSTSASNFRQVADFELTGAQDFALGL